ncbi:MAG: immunoglobulin domain-containing protein [Verrucomicrobia bacterium]|nr:immunoglobulin domain-containing protein [Verrucomicrobiota bacterium]
MNNYYTVANIYTDAGLANLKALLDNGYVVKFETYAPWGCRGWVPGTISNDPSTTEDDAYAGKQICTYVRALDWGHAMTIVGYNDSIWCDLNGNGVVDPVEKGALRVANSWGSWNEGGYVWFAYDAIKSTSAVTNWGPADKVYGFGYGNSSGNCVVYVTTAKASYNSSLMARFTVNHAQRNQIMMKVGMDTTTVTANPVKTWTAYGLSGDGGAYAFDGTTNACNGTFYLDMTDLAPQFASVTLVDPASSNETTVTPVANASSFNPSTGTANSATAWGWVDYTSAGPVPPTITTQPQSQTIAVGSIASFSVVAGGTSLLAYQWQKGGTDISGATTATYMIASVSAGDAASYTVRVSNSAGSVLSSAAILAVANPPTITTDPASQAIVQGNPVTFSVVAGGTAPLTYQWKKGGVNISGATSSSYTINSVQGADAGTYTVIVANVVGAATSKGAVLTIVVPPTITTQPQSQTVLLGAMASFSVVASGTAPLSYQWQKGGGDISCATTPTYTIAVVGPSDAGTYIVNVSNDAGSIVSSGATLTIPVAPTITTDPAAQMIVQGSPVTFSVLATGTSPLTYQWKKNGVNLAGATGSSYTIANVQTSDGGTYSVVVTNIAGTATSAGTLLTVVVPPSITSQPQNSLANATEAVTFSVVASGGGLSYQWYRDGTAIGTATSANYTITAQVADNGATFKVVVQNAYGSVTSSAAILYVPGCTAVTAPWGLLAVGSPTTAGKACTTTTRVTTYGMGIVGSIADAFTLISQTGNSDCEIKGLVSALGDTNATTKVGVTISALRRSSGEPAKPSRIDGINTYTAVDCFDALGLGAFTVVGVTVALESRCTPLWLWGPLLGAMTSAGGGILRDVVRADLDNPGLKGMFYAEVSLIWALAFSVFLLC